MHGAETYKLHNCTAIVAIGGGSPMDCAKAIGIVAAHGRSILEFEGADTTRDRYRFGRDGFSHATGILLVRQHALEHIVPVDKMMFQRDQNMPTNQRTTEPRHISVGCVCQVIQVFVRPDQWRQRKQASDHDGFVGYRAPEPAGQW